MSSPSGFNPSATITFVVKNNSSINRSIKIFNTRITPGGQLDLMDIPGVTEEDIRAEVLKGSLKSLLAGGSFQVLASTVNFNTSDPVQGAFLKSIGINPSGVSGTSNPLTQATWYIDANLGNDLNDGITSGTALKTFGELSRRWGTFNTLLPTGSSPTVTVNLLSNLPVTDPIDYKVSLGPSVGILFKGTTTTIGSGTFTNATPKNRATNQALELTDSTIASWIGSFGAGSATPARIKDTTNGSVFFPIKDIATNIARFSEPIVPIADVAGSHFPLISNTNRPGTAPTTGHTWIAESLTSVFVGNMTVTGNFASGTGLGGNSPSNVAFQDIQILRPNSGNSFTLVSEQSFVNVLFYGCILQPQYTISSETIMQYTRLRRGPIGTGSSIRLLACTMAGQIILQSLGFFIDLDTIFQGSPGAGNQNGLPLLNCAVKIGTCAVFDVSQAGPNNLTGAGLYLQGGVCRLGDAAVGADTTHALWGNGNAGAGIEVGPGSTFQYLTNAPTITGTGGDFKLSGASSSRAWDETANAGAGGWSTTLISNTWGNLVAAKPGGLGDAAVNVGTGSKIIKG